MKIKRKEKIPRKSVVVAIWKKTREDEVEVFTSLVGFLERYPHYVKATIENYITRRKVPYSDENVTINRVELQGRFNKSK